MDHSEISLLRLQNQHILHPKLSSAEKVLQWMGAIQAQDFPMAKWALGLRTPGSSEKSIEEELNTGRIIRTHVLRPTWHFVPAADVGWMIELTAPRIKTATNSRKKQLGLTKELMHRSNRVIEETIAKPVSRFETNGSTREAISAALKKAGFPTSDNMHAHLFLEAELDGIICSGPVANGKPTYALLAEVVPKPVKLSREEALGTLATRYFTSHGPATLKDFTWWSGLTVSDAKAALELIRSGLISETVDGQNYLSSKNIENVRQDHEKIFLLPSYDEFIISYKDRKAALVDKNFFRAVSSNGLFRPVIVKKGKVIGIWKRNIIKNELTIETQFFNKINGVKKKEIREAFLPLEKFFDKKNFNR